MDSKDRFSLLILEPNEIYFEDFAVHLLPDPAHNIAEPFPQPGRLKVCSKSLVLVPHALSQPIVKFAFRDCADIYHWPQGLFENNKDGAEVLAVSCGRQTELLAGDRLTPYKIVTISRLQRFKMLYARVEQHLQMLQQLRRAATLHAIEQNDMIATIVFSRHNRLKFDPLWLDDFTEPIIVDHIVEEISPLVTNPGRLLLTTRCVYFQPYNNVLPYPVKRLPLSGITTVTKRRFLLRHTSLEIQYMEPTDSRNQPQLLYVSFRSVAERNSFHDLMMQQPVLRLQHTPPETMTLRWQNGLVSNYDYLLHLNSLADRTAQDLTQYPIFPWVLTDYESAVLELGDARVYRDLSKPMGALDAQRLRRLHEKWETDEPKYLYGSHYSAPGLVLFYLVRRHPKLMLCLQNGRFDHPDRMFNSVAETFANCLHNMSDFKELIPEFYDTGAEAPGDFLQNSSKTDFGVRHTGLPVGNVRLPPWARGSPQRFVCMMRDALESEHVSRNLHHWIDLIFGYKQRGEEARKADNLFYHLCYEGSVDLDSVPDLADRHALEVQISEFGQIPKQLFEHPHVQRLSAASTTSGITATMAATDRHSGDVGAADISTDENAADELVLPATQITVLQLCATSHSHRNLITCVNIINTNSTNGGENSVQQPIIMSTGKDGLLKLYDTAAIGHSDNENDTSVCQLPCRSLTIAKLPISVAVPIVGSARIVLGSWDNSIITYNTDCGRIINQFTAHDDAVSCLSLVNADGADGDKWRGWLVSGSWDCSVKVWKGFGADDNAQQSTDTLLGQTFSYLQLEEKIASLHAIVADDDESLQVLIGTFAGQVHVWRPRWPRSSSLSLDTVVLHTHGDEVSAVRFAPGGRRAASCGLDGVLLVSDVQTRMQLIRVEHSAAWCCLDWPRAISEAGDFLLLGDDRGALNVWNMRTGVRQAVQEGAFGSDGDAAGGLVSALTACRRRRRQVPPNAVDVKETVEAHQAKKGEEEDEDDDELLVVAAGVDYPRDFSVKVFRVV